MLRLIYTKLLRQFQPAQCLFCRDFARSALRISSYYGLTKFSLTLKQPALCLPNALTDFTE